MYTSTKEGTASFSELSEFSYALQTVSFIQNILVCTNFGHVVVPRCFVLDIGIVRLETGEASGGVALAIIGSCCALHRSFRPSTSPLLVAFVGLLVHTVLSLKGFVGTPPQPLGPVTRRRVYLLTVI